MIPIMDNDSLLLDVVGSVVATVRFTFRVENERGQFIPYAGEVTSTNDRVAVRGIIVPLKKGKLLSATAQIIAGSSEIGQLFCIAFVRDVSFITRATIMEGYIYTTKTPSFPGRLMGSLEGRGNIVTNEADSTLVNNTALTRTITVPTGARWRIYGGSTLNGDDVTRAVTALVDDGTDEFVSWNLGNAGASVRVTYPNNTANARMNQDGPWPATQGDRIRITWAAGGASAGGTAKSSAHVEEWLAI